MDAEFTKALVGIVVTLCGLLVGVAGLLKGIRRDAKIAAESASRIREMEKNLKVLQGSTDRLWDVITGRSKARDVDARKIQFNDWDDETKEVSAS